MGLITRMLGLEAARVTAAFQGKTAKRQDDDLPLGIRVGSTVNFDQSTFILGGDELEFVPPQGRCLCKGYGKLRIDGFEYFRFYLQDDAQPSRDFVLQVGMIDGKPAEFLLYQPYLNPDACPDGEICPATQEDWRQWIGDKKGFIGDQYFEIPGGTQYDRVINPANTRRIKPFEYAENATFDALAAPSKFADLCGMTYGRTITANGIEVKEFSLPEKHEDSDGAFITVLIGVEMQQAEISVL